jgi:hypothetical protein
LDEERKNEFVWKASLCSQQCANQKGAILACRVSRKTAVRHLCPGSIRNEGDPAGPIRIGIRPHLISNDMRTYAFDTSGCATEANGLALDRTPRLRQRCGGELSPRTNRGTANASREGERANLREATAVQPL